MEFVRKDRSILVVLLNATAIHNKEGKYIRSRSTIIDHTERKKAEDSLKEALVKLEAANKELEAFSYSVSHDLRAPLRAIIGFSKILLEEYEEKLDNEGKRIINVIVTSTEKMGKLIDDLLSFSRLGRGELRSGMLDMNKLVDIVIHEISANDETIRKYVTIGRLPKVKGDSDMLKQVWLNLISNALKYTSLVKKVSIEIGAVKEKSETIFYVKDNGVGFDMQYYNKLFGVFQRLHTSKDYEGTGVGLAIVKRIITRHDGRVWAEGKINKGATFYFSIPNK
jgi:light-regulated signal transduction histidine kinase (bacteriophytochrome)